MSDGRFVWAPDQITIVHVKTGLKYSDDEPRDERGRWTSGGADDSKPGETAAGNDGNSKLTEITMGGSDKFGVPWSDAEAAAIKAENVGRIGAALAAQAESDPALKAQLQAMTAAQGGAELAVGAYLSHENPTEFAKLSDTEQAAHVLAAALQDTWASSSSDTNAASIGLQLAVADKFGIDSSELRSFSDIPSVSFTSPGGTPFESPVGQLPGGVQGTAGQMLNNYGITEAGGGTPYEVGRMLADSPAFAAYVNTVYADTQSRLAAAGITEISMYRGMNWIPPYGQVSNDILAGQPSYAESVMLANMIPEEFRSEGNSEGTLNPISSFSLDSSTAGDFAGGLNGRIITSTVDAARVFSFPQTGPGCANEDEVVVIGGLMKFSVYNTSEANDIPDWYEK